LARAHNLPESRYDVATSGGGSVLRTTDHDGKLPRRKAPEWSTGAGPAIRGGQTPGPATGEPIRAQSEETLRSFSRMPPRPTGRSGGTKGNTMKTYFAAVAAALLLSSAAYAGEIQIPSNRPVIAATVPDDWSTNETDTGIEINSADNSVYLAIDIASPKKTGDMIDEAAKFLDSQGVTIDEKTQKYTEDKLNGKDIIYIEWAGKDKDGPASVGLAALILDEKTVAVLTYWGTPGQEEKNSAAVGKILASIKSAE
jgi:hypothetical protein